MAKINY